MADAGIPNGIDIVELRLLRRTGLSPADVLAAATARAGEELGEPLGRLAQGAPADVLVVRGNPLKNLGALEKTLLVLVGGKRV